MQVNCWTLTHEQVTRVSSLPTTSTKTQPLGKCWSLYSPCLVSRAVMTYAGSRGASTPSSLILSRMLLSTLTTRLPNLRWSRRLSLSKTCQSSQIFTLFKYVQGKKRVDVDYTTLSECRLLAMCDYQLTFAARVVAKQPKKFERLRM